VSRKPIAAAVLAWMAASGCQAQSTVTIYGALDAYVAQQNASGSANRKVLNSGFNPNSLGFTGTEDLGDGLKAGFRLEGQPVLDTGTYGQGGKPFGRQSLLFVSGGWGRVEIGRVHTAGRAFGVKYSATGWLTPDPMGNLELAMGAGISPAMNGDTVGSRLSNAISYASPTLGGFSFSALQSAAEGGLLSAGQAKVSIVGLGYGAGPFTADLVVSSIPALPGSQIKQLDYGLGATYDFGVAKVLAAVQAKKGFAVPTVGSLNAVAGSEATDRFFVIGAQLPMATGLLGVSVGKLKVAGAHRGLRAANISAPFASVMDDATAWSLAYTYFLSKRTSLFAAYGAVNNAALGTASLVPDLRPTAGGNSSVLAAGIRHSF
jgi:predicted porin